MASHRRALNALVAVGTVTLVAAVLATFGRGGASGRPIRTGPPTAAVAEAPSSARPSTAALPTTTVASSTPSGSPGAAPTSPPGTGAPVAPVAPPAPVDSRHRWAVGTISFTLVDASRPT
ncbi:MAG: hypothetical protein M3N98_11865, partial [Actinomycetota bacterium]|nr:hypothetical protein [Actinomycetota bacterium]